MAIEQKLIQHFGYLKRNHLRTFEPISSLPYVESKEKCMNNYKVAKEFFKTENKYLKFLNYLQESL